MPEKGQTCELTESTLDYEAPCDSEPGLVLTAELQQHQLLLATCGFCLGNSPAPPAGHTAISQLAQINLPESGHHQTAEATLRADS